MSLVLLKGKRMQRLKVESVFAAVKSIVALGAEKDFLKECSKLDLSVSASPELINLLKTHVHAKLESGPADTPKGLASSASPAGDAKQLKVARRVRECDDTTEC